MLTEEIVANLTKLDITDRVGAEIMGLSREDYSENKPNGIPFTNQALNKVIDLLEEKGLTNKELRSEFDNSSEEVDAIVDYLQKTKLVYQMDG